MYDLDKTLPDDLKDFCLPVGMGNGKYFKSCAHLMVEKKDLGGEKVMEEKVKELEKKIEDLEKIVAEKDAKIKKLEAQSEEDLKKQIQNLEKENKELKDKIAELEDKLKKYYPPKGYYPEKGAESLDALKKKIKDLEDENKKLKNENKDLKAKVEDLENKLKKYYPPKGYYPAKEDLEKKENELKSLKEQIAKAKKEVADLKAELESRDARIKELSEKIMEKELAERTKQRIDEIVSETGFDFSEDRLERIKAEIKNLSDEDFKAYVDNMIDTVLASIPTEVVKIMKDIQEKEPDLSFNAAIQKSYEVYNASKNKEPADLSGAKSLASLNQERAENLYEKYKKL